MNAMGTGALDALSQIQAELKAPKNQFNSYGGFAYRSCEDILEALKPLLNKHNCTLILSDDIINIGQSNYVKATATLIDKTAGDNISNSAFAREAVTKKGMDDSQITGTASSYARKYALSGLFLIDDTKDADTNEYRKQNTQPEVICPKCGKPIPPGTKDGAVVSPAEILANIGMCVKCYKNGGKK